MNVTRKTPLEICLQFNDCYPNDAINDTASVVFPSTSNFHPDHVIRRKDDLEGAVKVLHLADIHVDEFYSVVL
jgi:hypothetical protein